MSRKVLSFGAHPDDIEIGCGGTEAKLIAQGYEVTHAYLTSGEAGSDTVPKGEMAETREGEGREAASVLGVKNVEFFRYPDGLTQFSREMKIEIINLIRRIQPEIVFVHASTDTFPDHQTIRDLVLSAITGAAGPWYQEAAGDPWSPKTVLGYEVWHPIPNYQIAVDISGTIEQKMRALSHYRSQIGTIKYDEAFLGLARYRGVMSMAGKYAEVFDIMKIGGFGIVAGL